MACLPTFDSNVFPYHIKQRKMSEIKEKKSIKRQIKQSVFHYRQPLSNCFCVCLFIPSKSTCHSVPPHLHREWNSQAAELSQPPTTPPSPGPSSLAMKAWKWGSPKTKVPPWRGYPPLSPTHWGLSGTVKGTILSLFTAAALNELVEGLY